MRGRVPLRSSFGLFSRLSASFAAALALFAPFGCSSSSSSGGTPPDGTTCGSTVSGGSDAASLTSALAGAGPGTCVLVTNATYTGHFNVPAGVTLASAKGSTATFVGDGDAPAIDVQANGKGGGLAAIEVSSAKAVGVAVHGGGATITNVGVLAANVAAIAIRCDGANCADDAHAVTLDNVRASHSALGVWISGARVTMQAGAVSVQSGESLTGGVGVIVQNGAHLTANGTSIDHNAATGVVIDGQGGTTATLSNVNVSNNGARGVWLQRAQGTIDAPALRIDGNSNIEANTLLGVGGADAHGIIIVGGRVTGTVAAPVLSNLGKTEQIGDGVGAFSGAGDIKLDGVELSANARTAALFDSATGAIIIVGGKVDASSSQLKVVVQSSSSAQVNIPADAISTPADHLGVSAPIVDLHQVL